MEKKQNGCSNCYFPVQRLLARISSGHHFQNSQTYIPLLHRFPDPAHQNYQIDEAKKKWTLPHLVRTHARPSSDPGLLFHARWERHSDVYQENDTRGNCTAVTDLILLTNTDIHKNNRNHHPERPNSLLTVYRNFSIFYFCSLKNFSSYSRFYDSIALFYLIYFSKRSFLQRSKLFFASSSSFNLHKLVNSYSIRSLPVSDYTCFRIP